jgi:phage terminase large subunit-like protein
MSVLHAEAARRARARQLDKEKASKRPELGVYDCMAKASPHLEPPLHFDRYVKALDSVLDENGRPATIKLCFSGPPQHGKTEIAKHALVSYCTRAPGLRHAFATYNFDRAREVAEKVRAIAYSVGLNPRLREGTLYLDGGSEIRFVGIGGGITGNPIDGALIVDDPIKGRKEAESTVQREAAWSWLTDEGFTRRHPNSSIVVMMTRWHLDDMIGRLVKLLKWEYLRIAAECDSTDDPNGREMGQALWDKRPMSFLEQFKASPYTWASMYQGRPRPRGDSLFGEPVWYKELPSAKGYVRGHGADLAYTEKTRADWSVLLSGRRYGDQIYATNELRKQCQAPEFTDLMKARQAGKGKILWLCSGTEKGVAQMIRKKIPQFGFRIASADKYMRATPAAEDFWNVGNFLLPEGAGWAEELAEEVCSFTGVSDLCDDRVDALAALCLLLGRNMIGKVRGDMADKVREQKTKTETARNIRSAFRR